MFGGGLGHVSQVMSSCAADRIQLLMPPNFDRKHWPRSYCRFINVGFHIYFSSFAAVSGLNLALALYLVPIYGDHQQFVPRRSSSQHFSFFHHIWLIAEGYFCHAFCERFELAIDQLVNRYSYLAIYGASCHWAAKCYFTCTALTD